VIDLAALSASVATAARGNAPIQGPSTWQGPPPELLQRLAFIAVLVKLAASRQQQLRAPAARDRTVSLDPPTPVSARTLAVQKIAERVTQARDAALSEQVTDIPLGVVKGAAAAGLAGLASGGISGGIAAIGESFSAAVAAAPAAVPLAVAGIIGSIVVPTIVSGELFSNKIDPVFDATTPEGMARAARQAVLIRQSLATTGTKFAFKGEADPLRFIPEV
jgi:hypothetical protein